MVVTWYFLPLTNKRKEICFGCRWDKGELLFNLIKMTILRDDSMYNLEKIYMFQNVSMGHLSEKGSNIPLKSLSTKETYMLHMKCTFKSHQKNFRAPLHWWIVSGIPDVCENLDPVCNFQFVNWKINRKLPPPQIGRISGWHVLTGFVTHVT